MTQIAILQSVFSVGLFLALWKYLTPFVNEFSHLVIERKDKAERTLEEDLGDRTELKHLRKEIAEKQQAQRARGVEAREEIINRVKADAQVAVNNAAEATERDLSQFRDDLSQLRTKLQREIEAEADELSKIVITRVSKGSGMPPLSSNEPVVH